MYKVRVRERVGLDNSLITKHKNLRLVVRDECLRLTGFKIMYVHIATVLFLLLIANYSCLLFSYIVNSTKQIFNGYVSYT